MKPKLLFFIFTLVLLYACNSDNQKRLGQVDLIVSGNEKAQAHFKTGLLYLHSFEYFDAIQEFKKAQEADPTSGMAYWGEIMSYNHPLFNREIPELAADVFKKMGSNSEERRSLFKTEMEKDLYESVEILFGEGTNSQRTEAYSNYYEKLAEKYKGNHEIESFYSLALLGSPRSSKTDALFEKAAKINQKILNENPQHPGALHYLIHAYDNPGHATLALDAANSYAVIAPDASHALHMPSHIFLALGAWNNVVNSNIDSWNSSVNGRNQTPMKELGYHSLQWLQYGLFQRAEYDLGTSLFTDMTYYATFDQSVLARSYMVAIKGNQMAETENWTGEIADFPIKIDDLHLTKKTGYNFLKGMTAYFSKDRKTLEDILKTIANDKYIASLNLGDIRFAMCNTAGNPSVPPNQLDIDIVTIIESELKAYLNKLDGKNNESLEELSKATKLFESLKLTMGPPVIFKPIHELYAEFLFGTNEFEEALKVLDNGLKIAPGRFKSLKLKEYALSQLGDTNALEAVKKQLEENTLAMPRKEILKYTFQQ